MQKKVHFGPQNGIQRLTTCKNFIFMRGEASFVFFFVDFVKIWQSFPLFYRKPAKNSQQILVECVQKHFTSALEKLPNFAKNL